MENPYFRPVGTPADVKLHPYSNPDKFGGDGTILSGRGAWECGDLSPLLRRRLVAVKRSCAFAHAGVMALARAVIAAVAHARRRQFDGDQSPRESGDKSPQSKWGTRGIECGDGDTRAGRPRSWGAISRRRAAGALRRADGRRRCGRPTCGRVLRCGTVSRASGSARSCGRP